MEVGVHFILIGHVFIFRRVSELDARGPIPEELGNLTKLFDLYVFSTDLMSSKGVSSDNGDCLVVHSMCQALGLYELGFGLELARIVQRWPEPI